ncbi:UNVERIFIED_CONTAM: hypothetical protein Sindi_0665400 [Sesamum indicum]
MAGAPMEDTFMVEKWLLHVDGSSPIQGSGAGIVITSPHGEDLESAVKFRFKASNNEVEYEALVVGMKMAQEIAKLKTGFESFQLIRIPREENVKADCLSKLASALEDCRTRHITIHHLPKPRAPLSVQAISPIEDWRTPVIRWLEEGQLHSNRWDAVRHKVQATHFLLQGGVLYKKSHASFAPVPVLAKGNTHS